MSWLRAVARMVAPVRGAALYAINRSAVSAVPGSQHKPATPWSRAVGQRGHSMTPIIESSVASHVRGSRGLALGSVQRHFSSQSVSADIINWVEAVTSEQGRGLDEPGSVVTLSEGVPWPGLGQQLSTNANVLFRRHFYDPLLDKVLNGMRPFEYKQRVVLIGTPGIGKSVLGVYAAAKALRAGRPVVYASKKQGWHFAAYPDGRVRNVEASFTEHVFAPEGVDEELYTANTNAVLICDSVTPSTEVTAFTIVVTSPQTSVWHEYEKDGNVAKLFIPNYTLSELQGLRAAAFPHITSEEVERRFGLYGGNPRLVLLWWEGAVESRIAASLAALRRDDIVTLGALDTANSFDKLLRVTTKGENQELGLSAADADYYGFAGVAPTTPYIADKLLTVAEELDAAFVRRLKKEGGEMGVFVSMAMEHRALK